MNYEMQMPDEMKRAIQEERALAKAHAQAASSRKTLAWMVAIAVVLSFPLSATYRALGLHDTYLDLNWDATPTAQLVERHVELKADFKLCQQSLWEGMQ